MAISAVSSITLPYLRRTAPQMHCVREERQRKHIRKAAHSRRKAVEAHQKGGGSTTERQRI